MTISKQESDLMNKQIEIEFELFANVKRLIDAKWDSNTLKRSIEELMKQRREIEKELFKLHEKE